MSVALSLQKKKGKEPGNASYEILGVVSIGPRQTTGAIVSLAKVQNIPDYIVKAELLNLERVGFVARQVLDKNDPLDKALWTITREGSDALRKGPPTGPAPPLRASNETIDPPVIPGVQVVMTCPADFKLQFANIATEESVTILKRLFTEASSEMRLVSPYLDNVIVDRFESELRSLAKKGVRLRIIFRDLNPQTQNAIHWLKMNFGDRFAYRRIWTPTAGGRGQSARGVHAKFFVIDDHTALLSSMNLTVNSINYNIEVGALIKDKSTVSTVIRIFDILWNNAGLSITV